MATSQVNQYEYLDVEMKNGVRILTLNRPNKYNSITTQMYKDWSTILDEAADDPNTTVLAVTGAGEYYSAGTAIGGGNNYENSGPAYKALVDTIIDFPKPLIGLVNGPAFGITVTTLGLFDIVYASSAATFTCPFTKLGVCAEGCSTYTFPRIMGPGLASEMLLFSKKLTAAEVCKAGLVTRVFPAESFRSETERILQDFGNNYSGSMMTSKRLMRHANKEMLHKMNRMEAEAVKKLFTSIDCQNAIKLFGERKSKM